MLVAQYQGHISRIRTSIGLRMSHVAAKSKCATVYDVHI